MLSDLASSSNDAIYIDSKMDIERMESPIQSSGLPMVIKREENVKYKSLLIPNGMRSSYWKYFGFPSEDGRTYLTKQKVVCALCSTLLAYNKNTTNLKSHLKSKHRDVVKNADLIIRPKKEIQKTVKMEPMNFKIALVTSMSPTSSNIAPEPQTNLPIDDLEFEPGEIPEPNVSGDLFIIDDEDSCTSNNIADEVVQYDEINPEILNITSSGHSVVEESNIYTIDLITDIIITDLLPISTISGTGFKNLMLNCLPQPIPKTFEIESQVNVLVEKRKSIVQSNIINLTKTKQFSIILNKFKIYTQDEYLVVIVNFINIETVIQKHDLDIELDVSKIEQKCYVYNIVPICNNEVNYSELLTNLNLMKCNSIIINYFNHSNLIDFLLDNNLNNNKIIIVPDFLDIIKNLIKNIFCSNNSGLSMIFREVCNSSCGNFNWYSQWMMLEDYLTRNSDSRGDDELSNLVGMIIDCLRPLKVTLDLLQNDYIIPNASLIKPLTKQLLENHFKLDYENDHSIIHEIKDMVNTELNSRLIDTPILSVLSFLDPRFTHLLTSSEIEYVREFLREKLEEITVEEKRKSIKKFGTANKSNSSKGSSSGLDYFFMLKNPKSSKSTNKFDHDFEKFMNEAATSLEQCPISWWAEFGYFYPSLSQLAKIYTNIPACYLEHHKIGTEDYVKFHKKRYLLDECTENVLYLHLTEPYIPWIE